MKKSIKNCKVFLPVARKIQNWSKKRVLNHVCLWQKKLNLFGDGEFTKNCLTIFTEYACPEKKHLVEHFAHCCLMPNNYLSDNNKETLNERLKSCAAFSQALDDSTYINDTAKLVMFIWSVTVGSVAVEEFFDMASLSSTTIGQDICEHVIRVVERFELNHVK